MSGAGLTRGAFYAHFASKSDLFCAVLDCEDLVFRLLEGRSAATPDALWIGMAHIFNRVLDPDHHALIEAHWGLPAFACDVAIADPDARAAYDTGYAALFAEICRGQPLQSHDRLRSVLSLMVGAYVIAAGCGDRSSKCHVLSSARRTVQTLMKSARPMANQRGNVLPKSRVRLGAGGHMSQVQATLQNLEANPRAKGLAKAVSTH
jgi:TetR/AcrR family transcriptional repressor of nem operon